MRIGILTFYKVKNFGANLQAISTYCYLKNKGYAPVMIYYDTRENYNDLNKNKNSKEWIGHLETINKVITNQTEVCFDYEDVEETIKKYSISAIIVGSDALLQHHPLISRIYVSRKHIIYIDRPNKERMFPNLFWGANLSSKIPMALMSVSSQNSEYKYFNPFVKKQMRTSLMNFKFITVRDTWTKKLVESILPSQNINVTPDPVFAFNQNSGILIPRKEYLLAKYNLPNKYILFSFFSQELDITTLKELKMLFEKDGVKAVLLPMPTGKKYEHPFDHVIQFPLPSIDWYALIKYSQGYIGNNMHPIVVSLHNRVPCFSIDNWGTINFWGNKKKNGSSKIEDLLQDYGLVANHAMVNHGVCKIDATYIYQQIKNFPFEIVDAKSNLYLQKYNNMMEDMLNTLIK